MTSLKKYYDDAEQNFQISIISGGEVQIESGKVLQ